MVEEPLGPLKNVIRTIERAAEAIERAVQGLMALVKFAVLPPLALLVAVWLIESYTSLGRTNGFLLILVLSVWYTTRRLGLTLDNVENSVAEIAVYSRSTFLENIPGATGVKIERHKEGMSTTLTLTVLRSDAPPLIVNPRVPKEGGR